MKITKNPCENLYRAQKVDFTFALSRNYSPGNPQNHPVMVFFTMARAGDYKGQQIEMTAAEALDLGNRLITFATK